MRCTSQRLCSMPTGGIFDDSKLKINGVPVNDVRREAPGIINRTRAKLTADDEGKLESTYLRGKK